MADPKDAPFIADTGDRIAERNARAAEVLAKKEGWDRTKGELGLRWANANDRVGSWFRNPDAQVANGLFSGAVRGLAVGILAFGLLSLGWATTPLWIVPASIAIFTAIDGYDAYQVTRAHDARREVAAYADSVAERAGALELRQTPAPLVEKKAQEIHEKINKYGAKDSTENGAEKIGHEPLRNPPSSPRSDLPSATEPLPERGEFTKKYLAERASRHPEGRGA